VSRRSKKSTETGPRPPPPPRVSVPDFASSHTTFPLSPSLFPLLLLLRSEEFKAKLKETEKIANPIISKVYQGSGAGGAPGGAPEGEDAEFGHEEL
jgi:hypothetical protein